MIGNWIVRSLQKQITCGDYILLIDLLMCTIDEQRGLIYNSGILSLRR